MRNLRLEIAHVSSPLRAAFAISRGALEALILLGFHGFSCNHIE